VSPRFENAMKSVCNHRASYLLIVADDAESRRRVDSLASVLEFPCRTFASAEEFLAKYDVTWSGSLFIDLQADPTHGLELQARLAGLGSRLPVVLVCPHGDVRTAVSAMRAGALTVLERPYLHEEMTEALRSAMALEGRRLETLSIREQERRRIAQLSPRERLVMQFLADCTPRKAIMQRLGISLRTVERVCAEVYKKTNTDNPVALARLLAEVEPSDGVKEAGFHTSASATH